MSQLNIEGLKATTTRKDFLPPEAMEAQINAVKNLVGAIHDQLVAHQINRDKAGSLPPEACRYDAFFRIPNEEVVMEINSVGLPDEVSANGLFLYMHTKHAQYGPDQIVGLQTAKVPEAVTEEEARWLSGYSPEQLNLLVDIVKTAVPMEKAAYELYMGRGTPKFHSEEEINQLIH